MCKDIFLDRTSKTTYNHLAYMFSFTFIVNIHISKYKKGEYVWIFSSQSILPIKNYFVLSCPPLLWWYSLPSTVWWTASLYRTLWENQHLLPWISLCLTWWESVHLDLWSVPEEVLLYQKPLVKERKNWQISIFRCWLRLLLSEDLCYLFSVLYLWGGLSWHLVPPVIWLIIVLFTDGSPAYPWPPSCCRMSSRVSLWLLENPSLDWKSLWLPVVQTLFSMPCSSVYYTLELQAPRSQPWPVNLSAVCSRWYISSVRTTASFTL